MSLDLIKELISEELINKINEELKEERKIIDEKWIGKIVDLDIENIMASEIFLDYYQIPLIELQDIVDEELPFLGELKVDVYPCVGDMGEEHCNISYASWDWRVWLNVCNFEVNNWSILNDGQKEQVKELFDELDEIYNKLDFDMGLYLEKLPEDFKDEDGNVYDGSYKRIV